jgi:hypothetical protein
VFEAWGVNDTGQVTGFGTAVFVGITTSAAIF